MPAVAYFIIKFVTVLLDVISWAMLIRAILSWLPFGDDNKISMLLYVITEPFIRPVRQLMKKMNWLQNSPIDVSFIITYFLITIISVMLSLTV